MLEMEPFIEKTEQIVGKTVAYVGAIRAPYGHTAGNLTLVGFTDGTRIILREGGSFLNESWHLEDIELEQAKKCPTFFSPDDLAEMLRLQEIRERQRSKAYEDKQRSEYERLKKQFG